MRLSHKCFICSKRIRSTDFPGKFFFWVQDGCFIEIVSTDYGGQFYVCREDFDWASRNRQLVIELVRSKLKALGYDLPMYFPDGDPNDA